MLQEHRPGALSGGGKKGIGSGFVKARVRWYLMTRFWYSQEYTFTRACQRGFIAIMVFRWLRMSRVYLVPAEPHVATHLLETLHRTALHGEGGVVHSGVETLAGQSNQRSQTLIELGGIHAAGGIDGEGIRRLSSR